MVVVGGKGSLGKLAGEFGGLWPAGAEWLWAFLFWTALAGLLGRGLRRPQRCARGAAPSSLSLDLHLLNMAGVVETFLLAFWLTVSLVVSLAISVPLAGALVRLRGKPTTSTSAIPCGAR